jgi:hypothetical protein
MARYLITTRRDARSPDGLTALDAVSSDPDVTIVSSGDPHMVTVETSTESADRLRDKLASTHFIEPEIRRGLH